MPHLETFCPIIHVTYTPRFHSYKIYSDTDPEGLKPKLESTMTDPSEIIYKFSSSKNRFILKLLLFLSVILVGVMIWFYKSIPEENLNRLLGKKTPYSNISYQSTPPKVDKKAKQAITASSAPKTQKEYKESIAKLTRKIEYDRKVIQQLHKKIEVLGKKVDKQKKIINQLLNN